LNTFVDVKGKLYLHFTAYICIYTELMHSKRHPGIRAHCFVKDMLLRLHLFFS